MNVGISSGVVDCVFFLYSHALTQAGSNTLTVFQISPNNPSDLKLLGKPVYSGGDFPVSVAINKAGDMVCALNSGALNGVR